MKKKTSVSLSSETLELADSIAEASDRSRSWVIEKAILTGLPTLDSKQAQELREREEKPKTKGSKA